MELRQFRYFATLAEELHFGRAAAREHIVQSALSQQIRRLERELRVALVDRSTHHVRLTEAGQLFAAETLRILAEIDRVVAATRAEISLDRIVRVAVGDASLDTMPQVLRAVRRNHPELELHQVEAGVPQQYRMLAAGQLDVGIGRASQAPPQIASEVVRLDPLGVLLHETHPWATREGVPISRLAKERVICR
jgi:DNA-binding transcriptional LysR family regulator